MDDLGDTGAELSDVQRGWRPAQIVTDERHGITSIAHGRVVMLRSLARAAIDDSDIVVCYDDAILTVSLRVFADERLFNDDGL